MYTVHLRQQISAPRAVSAPEGDCLQSPFSSAANTSCAESADDLSRRVCLFLTSANLPGLRRVRVDVVEDTVVIAGRVRTFYERQIAIERARRVAGVIQVDDQIEVDG